MKKQVGDKLFGASHSSGRAFHLNRTPEYLKRYESLLRQIYERGQREGMPSYRGIAKFLVEELGQPINRETVAKHINLLKKGQPLWPIS